MQKRLNGRETWVLVESEVGVTHDLAQARRTRDLRRELRVDGGSEVDRRKRTTVRYLTSRTMERSNTVPDVDEKLVE
jgi:hypothetical protein